MTGARNQIDDESHELDDDTSVDNFDWESRPQSKFEWRPGDVTLDEPEDDYDDDWRRDEDHGVVNQSCQQ